MPYLDLIFNRQFVLNSKNMQKSENVHIFSFISEIEISMILSEIIVGDQSENINH